MPIVTRRGAGRAVGLALGFGVAAAASAATAQEPPDTSRLSMPRAERDLLVHRQGFRPAHGAYALLDNPLRGWPLGFVWQRTAQEDVFVGTGGALHIAWSARAAGPLEAKAEAVLADTIRRRLAGAPDARVARAPYLWDPATPLQSALWTGMAVGSSAWDTASGETIDGRLVLRQQVAVLRDASRDYVVAVWYWHSGALQALDGIDADEWDALFRSTVSGFVPSTAERALMVVPAPELLRNLTRACSAVVESQHRGAWRLLGADPGPYERFAGDAEVGLASGPAAIALLQRRMGCEAAGLQYLLARDALLARSPSVARAASPTPSGDTGDPGPTWQAAAPAVAEAWRRVWKGVQAVESCVSELTRSSAFEWIGSGVTRERLEQELALLRGLMLELREAAPPPRSAPPRPGRPATSRTAPSPSPSPAHSRSG